MKALNCRYLVMFLGAAFVLLAVVAGYSTPTPPKRDSTVVITIAAAADPAPEEGLRLFLSSSGSLRDLDGVVLENPGLVKAVRRKDGRNKESARVITLEVADAKETSVATLSATLARIRAASDVKQETRVFVYLTRGRSKSSK